MNSFKPDILPNKHRPTSIEGFRCHSNEALRLKHWIQEFISDSNGGARNGNQQTNSDSDISSDSEQSQQAIIKPKCVLLTGPPGVGKTSLVYTIADELKLHVVESHSSEKRDFKLFSSLKLANQKGKINPIAKLFQFAQKEQHNNRRKRLKLISPNPPPPPDATTKLSLSSDISILLFDDVDVVFEEDGPFLKSLVEFIRESKRPVVLTATQHVEYIKNQLGFFEHINLNKPVIKDCALLLKDVCRRESYHKLSKISKCSKIADYYDCDIRQCLNRIHFYQDQADQFPQLNLTQPDFTRLNLNDDNESCDSSNKLLLRSYTINSLVDLMNDKLRLVSKSNSLKSWLDGRPSPKIEESYNFGQDLGEKIRESIIELNKSIHQDELMVDQKLFDEQKQFQEVRDQVLRVGHKISDRLVTRVEPHESDFFIDIVPLFGEIARLEAERKTFNSTNGEHVRRRTRRLPTYLDDNGIYFEADDIKEIGEISTGFGNYED